MPNMDSVRKKIVEKQQRQKAAGVKGYWQRKATIREDLYALVLNEGDRTHTESPSEVVNRALSLMQRLMDATGSNTFTEAAEKMIYAGNHYQNAYPSPSARSDSPLPSTRPDFPPSNPRPNPPPVQTDKSDAESQFEQLMNS